MRDERRHVAMSFQPARAWVRYEPLGVVGVIAPWNYPLLLTLGPMVDALAAGNRLMLKPSELTPRFSELLARLVTERFDSSQVAVVTGDVGAAEAFAALPFDHLIFTGSTTVGRKVMRAAAEHLTPVTLELGGKSPAIVAPDYPIAKAARSISFGKFVNAGQTCVAPDYVLVPTASAEQLAHSLLEAAEQAYPSIQTNEQYSNIISERHRARLTGAVEEARAAGATVLSHRDAAGHNGKLAPTIVLDAAPDSLLMREEIFGPVLPIVRYRTLDEAIAFVNARERPLALYCFTNDRRTRDLILAGAISGGVTVNGTLMHLAQDDLPFGGIGPSGTGGYHGRDGFRRFSHARAVHHIGFINAFEWLGPPWGKLAKGAARLLTRR
jgi:coniferyl-aldehyde dehydrogenase